MYSVRVVLLLYSFLALGLGTKDLPKEEEKIEEESGGIEIQVSLTEVAPDDVSDSPPPPPGACCPGSVTLEARTNASEHVTEKWGKYLGQYKPTGEEHEGHPVLQNQEGNFLYHHNKGQWRVNNVINKRGVFKGEMGGMGGECVSQVSRWTYWKDGEGGGEWRHGMDIELTCDQDAGGGETGTDYTDHEDSSEEKQSDFVSAEEQSHHRRRYPGGYGYGCNTRVESPQCDGYGHRRKEQYFACEMRKCVERCLQNPRYCRRNGWQSEITEEGKYECNQKCCGEAKRDYKRRYPCYRDPYNPYHKCEEVRCSVKRRRGYNYAKDKE